MSYSIKRKIHPWRLNTDFVLSEQYESMEMLQM